MTELARRQPAIGRNPTLAFLSGILIAAGLVALFAPELIRAFAPADIADPWLNNALALLLRERQGQVLHCNIAHGARL